MTVCEKFFGEKKEIKKEGLEWGGVSAQEKIKPVLNTSLFAPNNRKLNKFVLDYNSALNDNNKALAT